MSRYEHNRAARRAENERELMGETLAEFHAREHASQGKPGADLPRVPCARTADMFTGLRRNQDSPDLFDQPKPQEKP